MVTIEKPYRHHLLENYFSPEQFRQLVDFTHNTDWVYYDDVSFPQYIIQRNRVETFFLSNQNSREQFGYLFSAEYIAELEKQFFIALEKCVAVSFHRLIASNFNIVHNDFNTVGEKLRIICYLSAPESYEGGELNLFSKEQLDNPKVSYKLPANSAFAFEMNTTSFHSVSEVRSGERICIVITYQ